MDENVKDETRVVSKQKSENGFKRNFELDESDDSNHEEDENLENSQSKNDSLKTDENEENAESVESAQEPKKRGKLPFIIIGAVLIIGAIGGTAYWLYARQFESTDDAFIESDIVQISPKVSAYVEKVYVQENQTVKKGDLLVELDPKDYEAKLEQAKAQLKTAQSQKTQSQAAVDLTRKTNQAGLTQASSGVQSAKANVEQTRLAADSKQQLINQAQTQVKTAQANLAQTRAQLPQVEANLKLAQADAKRYLDLFNRGDISEQRYQQAETNLRSVQAQLDAAQKQTEAAQSRVGEAEANVAVARDNYRQSVAQVALTRSQIGENTGKLQEAQAAPERIAVNQSQVGTAEANIAQAETAVHEAELELSYTKVYAPEDGIVTRKIVQEGQLVQPGMALMALSQSDDLWVIANFKETQIGLMRVGQPVDIKVDAYSGKVFHGKIQSFQAGTGSRFSVLPSENATGNYVKVVQRIPVKIVFDETPENVHLLAPGMSVEPSVRIR